MAEIEVLLGLEFLFRSDTQAEIDLVKRIAIENGAFDAVMADHWAKGRSN
jgi:formyltetrahydrofolate synthetase